MGWYCTTKFSKFGTTLLQNTLKATLALKMHKIIKQNFYCIQDPMISIIITTKIYSLGLLSVFPLKGIYNLPTIRTNYNIHYKLL